MQAAMKTHENKLMALDRFFFLDKCFMAHVAGQGGQEHLEQQWCAECLATDAKACSVEDALAASTRILQGELFMYASQQAQGCINAAHAMLAQISNGQPPSMATQQTEFLKGVFTKLPKFVRVPAQSLGKAAKGKLETELQGKDLVGSRAILALWHDVEEVPTQECTLALFKWLGVFQHVLDAATRQQVVAKTQAVLAEAQKPRAKGTSSRSSKATVGRKRNAVDADLVADESARALLGM